MLLIINMKKEVIYLLFNFGHNFASWQCSATSCQVDTAEAHWLWIWDLATSTTFSWFITQRLQFFQHLNRSKIIPFQNSVGLAEVKLECWWCVWRGVYVVSTWYYYYCYCSRLCIFYMFAAWLYLHSTCMCVQICIFISRRCYFNETSPNNILLQP